MKLSVYIGVICLSLCMSLGVHAQTPTPHPNALLPGLYEFEDLSSPEMELTGIDWTICTIPNIVHEYLCNDNAGEIIEFYVSDVDYILIDAFFRTPSNDPVLEICIDGGSCANYAMYSTSPMDWLKINPTNNNSRITITTQNGENLRLNHMTLHQPYIDLSSISGTGGSGSSPTPTPAPYYIYGSVSGSSGDVDTRFDMIVTAGDVAISAALMFLLSSLWAAIFILFVVRRSHVGE